MLDAEEEASPQRKFIRQQWEAAMAATRVAMDSLREFWPVDCELTSIYEDDGIAIALGHLEEAYVLLASITVSMLGRPLAAVLSGDIKDSETLDTVLGSP